MSRLVCIPVLLAFLAADSLAQGIVLERRFESGTRPEIVRPREIDRLQRRQVYLKEHGVDISVRGRIAKTEIVQVFANPHRVQLEGVYLFPLPEGASLSAFTLRMGNKDIPGEVLDSNKAREIYRSIVHRRDDPGLLEYAGRGCIRARIFPIPARGTMRITLRYEQILDSVGGLTEIVYPLKSDNFAPGPVKIVGRIQVQSDAGVDALYSPTHKLDIVRKGDDSIVASFEEMRSPADRDLRVMFSEGSHGIGLLLSTNKPIAEDGSFLMVLNPKTGFADDKTLPKDVIFVVDTSGSMGDRGGKKLKQAKSALQYALGRLERTDRFNVISFATEARSFRDAIVPASAENVEAAIAYVDKLVATGGTAIHDALTKALKLDRVDGRVPIVLFLTDGQPTIGPADPDAIVRAAASANGAKARIFVFGVGDDVNTQLLGDLSENNGGSGHYVADNENIEVKVSALYDKVASPVLTDVVVKIDGAGDYDVYPKRIGDLFKGQQLVVVGRYTNAGPRAVTLQGRFGSQKVSFTYEGTFGTKSGRDDVSRLWAVRKVGFLMTEVRRHGAKSELVNEIKKLGLKYGIVTPYTSYLVVEEGELQRRRVRRLRPAGPNGGPMAAAAAREAAKRAQDMEEMKSDLDDAGRALASGEGGGRGAVAGARIAESLKGGLGGGSGGKYAGVGVKRVAGKSFRYVKGVWEQQAVKLPENYRTVTVKFLSDEYDELMKNPVLARWLAVGAKVRFFHEGVMYQIVR
ncbi:MAG: VIT and VWA domain-containing protein [Planctomycetota bacterium]|nr:VIT and VWA domain-containing protein [Planctomycetota bacterium]